MAVTLLTLVILGPAAVVVVALFLVLWRERTSTRDARLAIVSAGVLTLWGVVATVLAYRGVFQPQGAESVPPVGINLIVVLSVLLVSLATSTPLRRLLTRQANLIRLHLWRLVGVVFLVLMVRGQVPALWALPAGIGDILVAVSAPWVARDVDTPRGRPRAIIWNLFGIADLIVAVGLGIMTSPGPTQVFETAPTSELMTHFPMALVPTFLVPLAFVLHVISLWQLLGARWVPHPAGVICTEALMTPQAIFLISVVMGVVVWALIGARFFWPALRGRPRAEALRPLLLLHAFRFVGLAFLVPGVVSPDLPHAFARPAAYGDLATSLLALTAVATSGRPPGIIIVWLFNIVGTVDLLNAFYQANRLGVGNAPGLQGAAYFIPTVLVPLLLVTHALVFRILLRPDRVEVRHA